MGDALLNVHSATGGFAITQPPEPGQIKRIMRKEQEAAFRIAVVITTYNAPRWLAHVLTGYDCQDDPDFEVVIADDGSGPDTRDVIRSFAERGRLALRHVWHEDDGFRKAVILNRALRESEADYLIFTDGDCIPRADFVGVHRREARQGAFLSGGYVRLTMPVSRAVTEDDIRAQRVFDRRWLASVGQPRSAELFKLARRESMARALNRLTPTKATWNGMNSSTWRRDLLAVNGFDERLGYGGLDRELGERLWNHGLESVQIRHSAACVHLDHERSYERPEIWEQNYAVRDEVRASGRDWTPHGIVKG